MEHISEGQCVKQRSPDGNAPTGEEASHRRVLNNYDNFDFEDRGGAWFRTVDHGIVVKTFRYLQDELFLAACVLYAVNRWIVKPHVHNPFLLYHFNDLLLIPCALPPLLAIQRRLRLRDHDRMPQFGEIGLYFLVWSVLFELIGPHLMRGAIGDPLDVVAYAVGAVMAGIWWHGLRVCRLRWAS